MKYKAKKSHINDLLMYDGEEWLTNGHWVIRANKVLAGEVKLPKELESLVKAGVPFKSSSESLDTTLDDVDVKGIITGFLGGLGDQEDFLSVELSNLCFMRGDRLRGMSFCEDVPVCRVMKTYDSEGKISNIEYINEEYRPLLDEQYVYFDDSNAVGLVVAYNDDSCCLDSLQSMLAITRNYNNAVEEELGEVYDALVQRQKADTEEDQ